MFDWIDQHGGEPAVITDIFCDPLMLPRVPLQDHSILPLRVLLPAAAARRMKDVVKAGDQGQGNTINLVQLILSLVL